MTRSPEVIEQQHRVLMLQRSVDLAKLKRRKHTFLLRQLVREKAVLVSMETKLNMEQSQ